LVSPETLHDIQTEEEEIDVPEEMEGILDDLFQTIQDKVPGVSAHLLKRACSECFFRIPLFAGQQPKVSAGFLKDSPRTSLDKYWRR